jgi:hypothetical protein
VNGNGGGRNGTYSEPPPYNNGGWLW